jgi:Probable zinc-ribbon domain
MASNKQKRISIRARKAAKREKRIFEEANAAKQRRIDNLKLALARGELLVERDRLKKNSYSITGFMQRGTYAPVEFTCKECGKAEVWTPAQQKWWYEIAKGEVGSTAVRCRPCRRRERDRQAEARRVHLEGLARKQASKSI